MKIKVARIDAFQLDVQSAALNVMRPGGIAGHAIDHGNPEVGTGSRVQPALQPERKP
jgi:hypothetical protein